MLKEISRVIGMGVLIGMFFGVGGIKEADAEVNVGVHIGLPSFFLPAPPAVVVIPGTYVYAVPDVDLSILFYRGYWYRPHNGRWYRASSYNGPWAYIQLSRIPRVLVDLPPGSWRVPPGYHRIPHAQLRKNWGRWERERHWEREREWQTRGQERPEGRGGKDQERSRGHEERGGHDGRRRG